LESSKRNRKASEGSSEAKILVACSLAELGKKKAKKAMKKVSAVVVQCVPSAFSDEEVEDEPRRTSLFSYIFCKMRSGVHFVCTPSSENEFIDAETFQMHRLRLKLFLKDLLSLLPLKLKVPNFLPLVLRHLQNLLRRRSVL
jgi:hypothetical protein